MEEKLRVRIDPNDFVHWLRGVVDATNRSHPTQQQWLLICDYLSCTSLASEKYEYATAGQEVPRIDIETMEKEIQRKEKPAAHLTPADIEAVIVREYYFTAGDAWRTGVTDSVVNRIGFLKGSKVIRSLDCVTFCVLTLRNGYTVTGKCVWMSTEKFDDEIARKSARQNAVEKIWPLEGYLLKQRLHETYVD